MITDQALAAIVLAAVRVFVAVVGGLFGAGWFVFCVEVGGIPPYHAGLIVGAAIGTALLWRSTDGRVWPD